MSDSLRTASDRLDLSRQRLRQAMRASVNAPGAHQNPLLLAGNIAADAVDSAVRPIAQRNPIGLVLSAALAGGMLAWGRPWRWLFTPAVIGSVMPQLVSAALGSARPLSWMKLLTSLTHRQRRPKALVPRDKRP